MILEVRSDGTRHLELDDTATDIEEHLLQEIILLLGHVD
jgi:hypothetical protein